MAPSSASNASARVDVRSRPPLASSPRPIMRNCPRSSRSGVTAQSFARNEARAQLRQATFCFAREQMIEMLCHHQLKHGIAEKLETLIIEMMPLRFVPEARVRERFREQERIAEFVADALLERVQAANPTQSSLPFPEVAPFRRKILALLIDCEGRHESTARCRTGSRTFGVSGVRPRRCAASIASSSGLRPAISAASFMCGRSASKTNWPMPFVRLSCEHLPLLHGSQLDRQVRLHTVGEQRPPIRQDRFGHRDAEHSSAVQIHIGKFDRAAGGRLPDDERLVVMTADRRDRFRRT